MPNSIAFDRAAGYYDQTRGFPPNQDGAIAAMIARAGNLTHESRVLEVGVGTGRIALPLAPHVREIVGADLARPMMNRLREKQTTEPIRLVQADVTRLPFASASFDAVMAVHVFHLIEGWRDALQEVIRVLRPGTPLLYGRNRRTEFESFQPLRDAWNTMLSPERNKRIGVQFDEEDTFLEGQGWQRAAPRQTHRFSIRRTPRSVLEETEKRIWSGSWMLSDDEHQRLVNEVRRAMEANFPDPDQLFDIETGFHIDVFLPPEH